MTDQPDAGEQLATERAETLARLRGLEQDFLAIVESSGSAGDDDEHDPEGATVAYERQHVAALLGQAREHLGEIEAALGRLADGSYGTCQQCGEPIGAARLAARPVATRCIRCASR